MPRRPLPHALEAVVAPAPLPPVPGTIPRPALVARLAGLAPRPLTLVVAPTGYGKTTLLREWAARERRAVAWLTLEPADADPRRLWRRLAAAVGAPRTTSGDALLNELAAGGEQVLVLDDHQAVGGRACDEALALFLERLPENVSAIVVSRWEPGLEPGSAAAAGEVGRLGPEDLRLDRRELAAVAAQA